jgi:hypothetical protein
MSSGKEETETETNAPIITIDELRKLPSINYTNIQGIGNVPLLSEEQQEIYKKITGYVRYHVTNLLSEFGKEGISAENILQILYEKTWIYENIVDKLVKDETLGGSPNYSFDYAALQAIAKSNVRLFHP